MAKKNDWMDSYEDNDLIGEAMRDVLKKSFGDKINGQYYDAYVEYHHISDGKHRATINYTDKKGKDKTETFDISAWHDKDVFINQVKEFAKKIKGAK